MQLQVSVREDPVRSVNPNHRPERRWLVLSLACVVPALGGCGSTLYSIQATSASGKLEQARELGAEQSAPYEYFYAKEHLQKAQSEAAEADYSDAVNLAEASEEYAEKAIRIAREARSGAAK
ncbi:MAG TPA: DUF4398 domain-containing protein [Polyangiaceae bacterium]|nr:DUF4398 domain-containing protein [Polyangiaceae bacterium]